MVAAVSKDWACLPRDMVDLILDKVEVEFHDFIRFASICKSWQSTALATDSLRHGQSKLRFHLLKTCRNVLPMLMISTNNDCRNHQSLYDVTDERIHQLQLPISCTNRFVGSSKGWLFLLDDSKMITLINPCLNKTVVLPKLQLCEEEDTYTEMDIEYFVRKAILVPDQEREKYGVLILYSSQGWLAFLKPKAKAWETIKAGRNQHFLDIICYKGETYAVADNDALVRIDVTTGRCTTVVTFRPYRDEAPTNYLVESQEGDLLLIQRYMDTIEVANCDENTVGRPWLKHMDDILVTTTERFEVYKLSEQASSSCWVEIKSIGEQALFLGDNSSLSISTRDFPNCKPNSIYYVDHYYLINYRYIPPRDFEEDSGIYNMEDRSFTRHYTPHPSFLPSMPSIWVVPTFNNSLEKFSF